MLIFLFAILMIGIFGKMVMLAFRATWGLTKILLNLVVLPLFLIGLVCAGLMSLALPILIVVGIIMLIVKIVS
jgi:hypothetical protein